MSSRLDRRAFAAGALGLLGVGAAGAAFAQATRYGQLDRRESQYTTTYIDRQGHYIVMTFGVNECLFSESLYNPNDPAELPYAYTQFMTVPLAYTASAAKVLEIGLGGGRIASYIHDYVTEAHVTCVELDPGVIELAQRHFGVQQTERMRLVERDGRIFAQASREQYNIILVDAYMGTMVPFHLVTREFFQVLKRRLTPGGVVAQNISPDVLNRTDMIATVRAVFANADIYRAGGNYVLVAYDGPAKTADQLRERAEALQSRYELRYPLTAMLMGRTNATAPQSARVYTDDFAPVGYQDRDRECRARGRR